MGRVWGNPRIMGDTSLLGGAPIIQFDYYVSTTGNDSNNGKTPATAWAYTSFNNSGSANNAAMAGKRIGLIQGTYRLSQLTSGHTGTGDYTWSQMNLPGGNVLSSTYVASCNSFGIYTPRVAIVLVDTLTVNGCIGGGGGQAGGGTASYITVDAIVVDGNNIGGGAANELMHLIGFWGSYNATSPSAASETGIIVENCELKNITTTTHSGGENTAAIWFEGCFGCIARNNYIHDIGSTASADQDHTHGIEEYGCYANQYIYNTFANCSSGIESKLATAGTICYGNYFFNVAVSQGGAASVFEGFDGATGNPNTGVSPVTYQIHHNVMDSCGPMHLADINTSFVGQAISIYNNTTYDAQTGATVGWQLYSTTQVLNYYNNIYYSTASSTGGGGGKNGKVVVGAGGWFTLDYNCWYQAAGNYSDMWGINTTAYNVFANWQAATSAEVHSISGSNPTFSTSIVAGNGPIQFQLGSGSPCIGTGQTGINMGAWDGTFTQIGANWVQSAGVYPITADSSG